MSTHISYRSTKEAWEGFGPFLEELINENKLKKICDVGGGANPVLSEEYIKERSIDYSLLDISETELKKAPENYHKILGDIASPNLELDQKYDLVFSKMLAEHIYDAKQFHKNVLNSLEQNGFAVHFFPTLYTLPFIANYLFPERLASFLLNKLAPRDRHQFEKFPAYYRWCRGPSRRQIEKFNSLGYTVVEYRGFFGHSGYYNKIDVLKKVHNWKTRYLLRHPNPNFTSFAYIVLQKAQ